MGDVSTHATIAKDIMELLDLLRGPRDESEAFFQLGNYLTDVSQVRDPFAHILAKKKIWEGAKKSSRKANLPIVLDVYVRFDEYLDELFGKPGQDGLAALYMRDLVYIMGLEEFRDRGKGGIDVAEFDSIFTKHWTQYWPHEHLDFPPWPFLSVLGDRRPSKRSKHDCRGNGSQGTRGIPQYLDDQLVYVSELLSKIELEWARAVPTTANLEQRHELLARFGHASHAIEDFFFHSNFVEIAWENQWGDLPDEDEADADAPDSAPMNKVRRQRIFDRRRRAPTADGDELSRKKDAPYAEQVYTESFGGEDVFHVLMDLVEGLLAKAKQNDRVHPEWLQRAERIVHGTEEEKEQDLKKHRELLKPRAELGGDSAYGFWADQMVARGKMHPSSAVRWKDMCWIDWELGETYHRPEPLGIFGFLQKLGGMAKTMHEASEKRSEQLDREGVTHDGRTHNGASAENIGSHTLMAKDSPRNQPLRQQAIRLAKHATLAVAATMARSVNQLSLARSRGAGGVLNTVDSGRFTDWEHFLHHFLCHPKEALGPSGEQHWWVGALDDPQVRSGHVVRTIDLAEARRRAKEPMKSRLEERYRALEKPAEALWVQQVRKEFIQDVAVLAVGVLAGGIAGGLAGYREGGVAGAIAGASAGAVLGGAGAAVGAMLGGHQAGPGGALLGGLAGAAAGAGLAHALPGAIGKLKDVVRAPDRPQVPDRDPGLAALA